MTIFCSNCGEPIAGENAIVCPNCGNPTSNEASFHFGGDSKESKASGTKKTDSYLSSTQTKSPFLAVLLSFIWPGLGQVYNGRFWKGILFYFGVPIGYFCFFIPGLIIKIWCMWDAHKESEKMNQKVLPYKEPTVWELIIFLCIRFAIYFAVILAYVLFFMAMFMAMISTVPYY